MLKVGYTADTREWQRIKRQLLAANRKSLQIGWLDGELHSQATENGPPIPLAQLAKWLHDGTVSSDGRSTPPRKFIQNGFMVYLRNRPEFEASLRRALPMILAGSLTWDRFYESMGKQMVELMQMVMDSWSSPANAPLTIALKGRDDPLDKTGELISKVKWRLGDKEFL